MQRIFEQFNRPLFVLLSQREYAETLAGRRLAEPVCQFPIEDARFLIQDGLQCNQ